MEFDQTGITAVFEDVGMVGSKSGMRRPFHIQRGVPVGPFAPST